MNNINFDNPYYLLIALPLIAVFAVPFFIAIGKENKNGHNIASFVLHVVLAIVVAFAAAGTKIKTVLTETDVYVVADVSYSTSAKLDLIDSYIKGIKTPRNTKLGIITFGKDSEILTSLGGTVRSVKESTVDTSETDIASALDFAGALFKDDVIKHIVLITDGKATANADSYAITRAVDSLENKGIRVDAIYLDSNLSSDVKEVQVTDVDYTRSAFIGREEQVLVGVKSTYDTSATVTLIKGDEEVRTRVVELAEGRNAIMFDLDTSVAGTFNYEVKIEVTDDHNPNNNSFLFSQKVTDDLRVLYVTQSWADAKNALNRYQSGANVDVYCDDYVSNDEINTFIRRLKESKQQVGERIDVHVYRNLNVPNAIERLCEYDEIVLSSIKVSEIGAYGKFIDSLDTVVSKFGKSLLTLGNVEMLSETDEQQAKLEDMLPVKFGNTAKDARLYTIVLDASRSMNQNYHLIVAKQLAIKLLNLLEDDKDAICLVNFYGESQVSLMPTKIGPNNRQQIIDMINGMTGKNGTVIGGGLNAAYNAIQYQTMYADKQLMLISDGLNYSAGGSSAPAPRDIVEEMNAAGIVTSVFDVGRGGNSPQGGNDAERAAMQLLQDIASLGGGNYFYSNNLDELSDELFGDIMLGLNGAEIKATSPVRVQRTVDDVLKGVNYEMEWPNVSSFVYSTIKPTADTVLTVDYYKGSVTRSVPLYAHWNYGNGKVASFTSKEGDNWLREWDGNEETSKFFVNMLGQSVPDEKNPAPYKVDASWNGTTCRITVSPPYYQYNTSANIKITDPDGNDFVMEMGISGSDFYYEFKASKLGAYMVDINYFVGSTAYSTSEVFCLSVMPEYDSFASFSPSELYKALNGRGTLSTDGKLTVENDEKTMASYTVELTVPLLIAAVVLFMADVIIRKLKWEDILSLFGLVNKKKGGKKA